MRPRGRSRGLCRRLAPGRHRPQHAEKPLVGTAAQAEPPPRLVRLGAVDRRIDQVGHLLGKPLAAAVFAEDLLQPLIHRAQMDHVGQRVFDLPVGQWPVRPVGEARGLVEAGAGKTPHQSFVADRVAEPANHRGDLGVEHRVRHLARQLKEDLQILPGRVKHLQHRRVGHQRQQRRQVETRRQRIDRHRLVRAGDLYDTKDRPEGPLAHELRIHRDELGGPLSRTEGGKHLVIGNQCHASALYTEIHRA